MAFNETKYQVLNTRSLVEDLAPSFSVRYFHWSTSSARDADKVRADDRAMLDAHQQRNTKEVLQEDSADTRGGAEATRAHRRCRRGRAGRSCRFFKCEMR